MTEIILAIIGAIVSVITGLLVWKERKRDQEIKITEQEHTVEQAFIEKLITRVDTLETRFDALSDDLALEREKYEQRIKDVRKEMQRLLEEATIETSTWRDRYFKAMDEYHELKREHNDLKIEHANIRAELAKLEKEYQALIHMYKPRTSPDIGQTS